VKKAGLGKQDFCDFLIARSDPEMLETPILFAIALLVVCGIVWWLYRSG
jgi:hypothetical protein